MYPTTIGDWWLYLSPVLRDTINITIILGCLSLWLHRKDLKLAWQRARPRSLRFNLLAFAVDTVVVVIPLGYLVWLMEGFLHSKGWVLLHGKYLTHLNFWVIVPLAIFAGDFVAYFRHRFEHSRWIWPSHVMHHSDTDLHWLSVYRFHPINRLTTSVIDSGALILMGFPPGPVFLSSLFRHYYGILVHMNVPWTFGPFGKIFVSPAMHRWHHVREGKGVGSNFASIFSIFDRGFGTLYMPGPCMEPLGVTEVDNDAYLQQLIWPISRAFSALRPKRRSSSPETTSSEVKVEEPLP